jgi:DNA polymerase III subunit delta
MDSFAFLESPAQASPSPVYVVYGEDDFLKRQVLVELRNRILGGDETLGWNVYPGDKAEFAEVRDELSTLAFLCKRRLVQVAQADAFVTKWRAQLEKYVDAPSQHGVLVLEVKSWPANTRLAKLVPPQATLVCKALPAYKLPEWCASWTKSRHGKSMNTTAARLLVDLVGGDMGLLDQELVKLAAFVGAAAKIEPDDVDRLVGNSRMENTWKIFDAIGAGQVEESLRFVDRLFEQGEEPMRLLGAFSMTLRRLAQAATLAGQGLPLGQALAQAGVPPFAQRAAEQQLRHLGRGRLAKVFDWLLELDAGLKGGSNLPERTLFERLIIRLARKETALR